MAGARAWTGWALVAAAVFAPGCASGARGSGEGWAGSRPAATETSWMSSTSASKSDYVPAPHRGFWKQIWHPFTKEGREETRQEAERVKQERAARPKEPVTFWEVVGAILLGAVYLALLGAGGSAS